MVSLKVIKDFNIPKAIFVYEEGVRNLDFKKIKKFIRDNFVNIKINLIRLKKKVVCTKGLLFDFIGTQKLFSELKYSKLKDTCHIILTDKLFVTLDQKSNPHIRAIICSFPSLISISGIVEGPAKPKEYYIYKQKYTQLGIWGIEGERVRQRFKGQFIDYDDNRLTEVIKGYIAQAIFFYITGEPFCKNRTCRLFNAHWQEDLIHAQITKGIFCLHHKNTIDKIKKVK